MKLLSHLTSHFSAADGTRGFSLPGCAFRSTGVETSRDYKCNARLGTNLVLSARLVPEDSGEIRGRPGAFLASVLLHTAIVVLLLAVRFTVSVPAVSHLIMPLVQPSPAPRRSAPLRSQRRFSVPFRALPISPVMATLSSPRRTAAIEPPAPPVVALTPASGFLRTMAPSPEIGPPPAAQGEAFSAADASPAASNVAGGATGGFSPAGKAFNPNPALNCPAIGGVVRPGGFDTPKPLASVPLARYDRTGAADGFSSAESGAPRGDARVQNGNTGRAGGFDAAAANLDPAHPGLVRTAVFAGTSDNPVTAPNRAKERPRETQLEIVSKPRPLYAEEARRLHVEGEVVLEAVFRATGEITVIRVVSGLGHGLDERAIEAANGIHFRPAAVNGIPKDTIAKVIITFQLAR